MAPEKSMKVPKALETVYEGLTDMTDRFCADHLNDEYAELARQAVAALCRKRPCPLTSGYAQTWACAVLYALGQVNFLSDKASKPCMAMADLCAGFGVASSTAASKAKLVRKALDIHQFDHKWMLPSRIGGSKMVWMIGVNGFIVDARTMPIEIQEEAVRKGLIPPIR